MKTRYSLILLLLLTAVSLQAQSPMLAGTSPKKANINTRLNVSISGTNTHFVQGTQSSVYFTQGTRTILYPRSYKAISETLIKADMDISNNTPLGRYDVHVINNVDGHLKLPSYFTIAKARLISTNPTSAMQGETLPITISGNSTHFNQATQTRVFLSQGSNTIIYARSASATNGTFLNTSFKIPSGAKTGRYDVNVHNEIDGEMALKAYFTINANPNAARLVLINPDEGNIGKTLSVSISGTKTEFTQGTATYVYFTQGTQTVLPGTAISITNDTLLSTQLSIPANANLGDYDVQVVKPGIDFYRRDKGFTVVDKVAPPTVVYLDPDSVIKGKIAQIKLYGRGAFFTRSSSIKIDLIGRSNIFRPAGISVVNDTTLSFSVDTRSSTIDTGYYDVELTHGYYNSPIKILKGLKIVSPVGRNPVANKRLALYPNPAQHTVTIAHGDFSDFSSIKLIDMTSKRVYNAAILVRQDNSTTLDLGHLPRGSYVIELTAKEGTYTALLFRQ